VVKEAGVGAVVATVRHWGSRRPAVGWWNPGAHGAQTMSRVPSLAAATFWSLPQLERALHWRALVSVGGSTSYSSATQSPGVPHARSDVAVGAVASNRPSPSHVAQGTHASARCDSSARKVPVGQGRHSCRAAVLAGRRVLPAAARPLLRARGLARGAALVVVGRAVPAHRVVPVEDGVRAELQHWPVGHVGVFSAHCCTLVVALAWHQPAEQAVHVCLVVRR
jgi:hypothetical protein